MILHLFFQPILTLTLWHRLQLQYCQPLSNAVLRKKECFALKIDLQLVLFHSICRTLHPSSERWRAVHLLCLLCWVGGGCGCNSPDFCAHIARLLSFFVFFLRFVSQPCPHYPFSSSIMVQGLLNFSSLGTKFRKSTLTPGPGLMTTSSCCTNQYSWHGGTRKQAPQPFQVPTHDIVGKKNLLKYT